MKKEKRKFSSYGTVIQSHHYYAPRLELIEEGKNLLIGDETGGHYFTVWASRQSGKSTTLMNIHTDIRINHKEFDIVSLTCENQYEITNEIDVMNYLIEEINKYLQLKKDVKTIKTSKDFVNFFSSEYLDKKIILIIDEFDALEECVIAKLAHAFREIYLKLKNCEEGNKPMLQGLALIGIRSVLGIENKKGSPFNIQNSLRIPQLTYNEVNKMFKDYTLEHNQVIDQDVIDILFYETQGQPGLTSWFGELLTVTFNKEKDKPIKMINWKYAYAKVNSLPSTHLSNLISKVNETEESKELVINLFQTKKKHPFVFRKPLHNYLHLNGIIKPEEGIDEKGEPIDYIKFTCQFIHRQLFEYFVDDYVNFDGKLLTDPFIELDHIFGDDYIVIDEVVKIYQEYIDVNKENLFKDASRRKDLRIFEAVYHFDIYAYLTRFFQSTNISIHPEFPTGNGKIDLIFKQKNDIYGLELKSFSTMIEYKKALTQCADYANSLGIKYITLLFFTEDKISVESRTKLEKSYFNEETNIEVKPRFIQV